MRKETFTIRLSDDDLNYLSEITAELDKRYPLPDNFNRSEAIRWCIRTAYGNLSMGKRSDTP